MSVREKDRDKNDFQIFIKAKNLTIHTDIILANKKVFECKSQLDVNFLKTISSCALSIFTNCWKANNIHVTSKKSYLRRNSYQQDALDNCNDLLAYIDLSRGKFHLYKKKYLYWKDLSIEVKKLIYSWKESDNKRYKEYRK